MRVNGLPQFIFQNQFSRVLELRMLRAAVPIMAVLGGAYGVAQETSSPTGNVRRIRRASLEAAISSAMIYFTKGFYPLAAALSTAYRVGYAKDGLNRAYEVAKGMIVFSTGYVGWFLGTLLTSVFLQSDIHALKKLTQGSFRTHLKAQPRKILDPKTNKKVVNPLYLLERRLQSLDRKVQAIVQANTLQPSRRMIDRFEAAKASVQKFLENETTHQHLSEAIHASILDDAARSSALKTARQSLAQFTERLGLTHGMYHSANRVINPIFGFLVGTAVGFKLLQPVKAMLANRLPGLKDTWGTHRWIPGKLYVLDNFWRDVKQSLTGDLGHESSEGAGFFMGGSSHGGGH